MSQTFEGLGLRAELCRAVSEEGYTSPTPIQVAAIGPILEGRDVRAAAQTGTGKTAGFALPMLQRLAAAADASAPRPLRALVLTPTRELALQVQESITAYGRHLPLSSTLVFGGVAMGPQVEALARGVDILVATPGRLLDHVAEKTVHLSSVQILVLDEADRMLDMGFIHDIRKVLALLPPRRQNLLFSATFPPEIVELASALLHDPVAVQVARPNADAELVEQKVYGVDPARKRELLCQLVREGDWQQVLVFTRTKHGANRLAMQLTKQGITADAIHGNRSQPQRLRALKNFKDGVIRVLVATDIAARGIDIEELPHVVNYDLPRVPEDYVHRIGRTGRAGNAGEAVSLVTPEDEPLLADIEKLLQKKVARTLVPGFEPGCVAPEGAAPPPPREAPPPRRPETPRRERESRPPRAAGEGQPPQAREERQPAEARAERPPRLPAEGQPAQPREERQPLDPRAERPPRPQRRNLPSLLRGPMDERALQARGNVALPGEERWSDAAALDEEDDEDHRQPLSNESSLFPSSGRVFGEPRVRGGAGRHGGGGGGGAGGNAGGNRAPRPEAQKKRGGPKPGGGGQRRRGKGGGQPAAGNPRRAG